MTEEIATLFANHPEAGRLDLGIGPISDRPLQILVQSQLSVTLREVQSLNDEQVQILSTAADSVPGGPFGGQTKIRLPKLKTLDSPLLAATLLRCSAGFDSVTTISLDAAAALASVPNRQTKNPDGTVRVLPPYGLAFPSLTELSYDCAQLLMTHNWSGISLPSVQEVSPDTLRSLVQRSSYLELGIAKLSPELAFTLSEMASNPVDLGGGILSFPSLMELTPDVARILVRSLNRGNELSSFGGLNRAPQLFLGGRRPWSVSVLNGSLPLTPELASELAGYRGRLSFANLEELSPRVAAELATYRGPILGLVGPATDRLSPETAAALAKFTGKLEMPLRVLDSIPLAEKYARDKRTVDWLEVISATVVPTYVKQDNFFTHRQLAVLDSPIIAARLIQDSSGQSLPSLQTISREAAEVLATGPNALFLGLIVLDDPAVARSLANSPKGAQLPRLRAATPEVLAILKAAPSIKTPPLDSIYLLSPN
jgi:hypothetical protein